MTQAGMNPLTASLWINAPIPNGDTSRTASHCSDSRSQTVRVVAEEPRHREVAHAVRPQLGQLGRIGLGPLLFRYELLTVGQVHDAQARQLGDLLLQRQP
ncbi:hypothetical protein [Streptomyces sp. NPDC055400]